MYVFYDKYSRNYPLSVEYSDVLMFSVIFPSTKFPPKHFPCHREFFFSSNQRIMNSNQTGVDCQALRGKKSSVNSF